MAKRKRCVRSVMWLGTTYVTPHLEVEDKSFFHESVVLLQLILLALLFSDEGA